MVVIVAGLILAVLVVMFAYGLGAIFYVLLAIIGLILLGYTINYRSELKKLQLEAERERADPTKTSKISYHERVSENSDNEAEKKLEKYKNVTGYTYMQLWGVYALLVVAVVVIQIYCEFLADKFL